LTALSLQQSGPVWADASATEAERPGLNEAEIDALVLRAMETFNVPGIAVGIIKDGTVIHAKGYGVREVGKTGDVDTETLFSIASTGKSFTAAALALLVDEGKITWKDKVIDHIPAFQLYDPWVTREFTIKDLLIHNSGLGLGAGDLMMFPSPAFSRTEIIENLKYLKPVTSFRSEFAYDNLLYIVAGEVVKAVSGLSYEDFVDQRILEPLDMEHCFANVTGLKGNDNIANPHMVRDGLLVATERDVKLGQENLFAAAGGMQCSVQSILKWHALHLAKGKLPGGAQFLSAAQQAHLMTPHTILPVSSVSKNSFGTSFSAYGLGWSLSDIHGTKIEQHSGGLLGMLSLNAMLPDLGIGVVIYTNQQAVGARPAIMNTILEAYLIDSQTDWTARFEEMLQGRRAEADKVVASAEAVAYTPVGDAGRYSGSYSDPWFGKVIITQSDDGLYFTSERSARLKGKMVPYKPDVYIVHWDDRTLDADAYVKFTTDFGGRPTGITMKAVSPLTDFSFDFHDLEFSRVEE